MQRVSLVLVISYSILSSVLCLKLTPSDTQLTFTSGASITLKCENDRPVEWKYPEYDPEPEDNNSNKTIINHSTDAEGIYRSELRIENAFYMDTGYYKCLSERNGGTVYDEENIYIFVEDENHPIATNKSYYVIQVNEFGDIVIPCKPTSPEIVPVLKNEQEEVVLDNMSFVYDPKIGFTKSSPMVTDSGLYICEANGNYRKEFQIHVNPRTTKIFRPFIDETSAYHPVVGSNVVLNCSVTLSHGDILFINWKYPNDKVKEKVLEGPQSEVRNDNGLAYMNYKSITIANVNEDDQGTYTCVVSDTTGSNKMESTFYLNVFAANTSIMNLTVHGNLEWTVHAGEKSVQWVVNVLSYPRPGITWLDPTGRQIYEGTSPNGKYTTSFNGRIAKLLINRIDINDSGTYTMTAFNGHLKKHLKPVLFVRDKPETKLSVSNVFLYSLNENYSIECTSTAYPLPKIRWYFQACIKYPECERVPFNFIPVESYFETGIFQHVLKSTLKINASQSIVLTCAAENELGSSNSSLIMQVTDVKGGYAVSLSPDIITVNDDVTLTCAASKYRFTDSIMWYFNGTKGTSFVELIPVKLIGGIEIKNSTSQYSYGVLLEIPNIQKNFSGQYICMATFTNGSKVSHLKSIHVNVQVPIRPTWNRTNMNGTVYKARTMKEVKFECQGFGLPPPTITWFKDKMPIHVINDSQIHMYRNNQTLVIKYATLRDAGEYTCVAENKAGNITAMEILDFIDKPDEHGHLIIYLIFVIGTLLCITCMFWLVIRIQKERKLRKELAATGLLNFEEGAVGSLNPELGIEDQADLLPYDRRWEFPREKLVFGKQLGSGAFGVVMKAEANGIIDPNTATTVAVKMVKRGADPLHIRALASELKIMIHLGRHLNVVNLLGACTRDIYKRELVVIVEYCKYGNLHDFLLKHRNHFINQIVAEGDLDFTIDADENSRCSTMINNAFTHSINTTITTNVSAVEETPIGSDGYLLTNDAEPEWRSNYRGDYRNTIVRPIKTQDLICWSFQIARGMDYLASRKVLHGDLAARNVLLADDNVVKICDFGLAKSMYNNVNYQRNRHELLPVRWMAIESIRDRTFSIQSDIWSYGITMWELFSLSVTPYPGVEQLETLFKKLASGHRLEPPMYATKEIYNIMKDCWHENPMSRPPFTELIERLGSLLEDGVRSHYTNLNEIYLKMNEDMNMPVDYLELLNPPVHSNGEERRYMNIPVRRGSTELEEDVELKPMLPSTDKKIINNVNPISFSNPNYAQLTRS